MQKSVALEIQGHINCKPRFIEAEPLTYIYANLCCLSFIQDYHTTRYGHPTLDTSQNWFIDYGYEENGWTVLGFHRRLDTCDVTDDRKITVRKIALSSIDVFSLLVCLYMDVCLCENTSELCTWMCVYVRIQANSVHGCVSM